MITIHKTTKEWDKQLLTSRVISDYITLGHLETAVSMEALNFKGKLNNDDVQNVIDNIQNKLRELM